MADIFISYASEDRSRVEPLAKALEDQGWSVFWDRTIPAGKTWRQVIGDALETARSVIVAWSSTSVDSRWVQEEADRGLERNILIPILIDNVRPPLGFGSVQAADLIKWDPSQSSPEFEKLISDLSTILGPSPLKVKEAEQKRAEEERRRKQEDERKRIQATRKAEEERKQKEVAAKRKAEEEQKRDELKAKIKPDKPEPVKIKPPESKPDAKAPTEARPAPPIPPKPRKARNALIFGAVAGVIVLLMTGGWLYYKNQQEKETRTKIEWFYEQVEELERAVAEVDNQEILKELFSQRDQLNKQVAAFSEQAAKVGLESKSEQLQDRLKQIQIQLANKEKELIAVRRGRIFVESVPDNATVKILNIDEPFQQGMELEPGLFQLKVSSEGYETKIVTFSLDSGKEERIRVELAKIETPKPPSPQKVIENSIGMKFVLIPAGKFVMGSPPDEPGRENGERQHEVSISKPFYMQTTEVTQGQWRRVMRNNPSLFKECGADCPVERESWVDAQKFIEKLNQMEGINKYRLPSESEWEYACRAGTKTAYSFGDEVDTLGEYAWYSNNSEVQTHPVGKKMLNAWGLYDMHGNVWEWCQDWYGLYPISQFSDPKGPDKGRGRVKRGGSYFNSVTALRSAKRIWDNPDERGNSANGFRVARDF